jgi:predicted glycogen debranching enzyme
MTGDGLISAGSQKTQLTWMDAAIGGIVFTPRGGKAVEVNALWYHVLVGAAELLAEQRPERAEHFQKLAARIRRSFGKVFWDEGMGCLVDHVWTDAEGLERRDGSLRPNQIFAVSLPHSPLPRTRQEQVVAVVREKLLTPYGLRTLAAGDRNYRGRYTGNQYSRDEAYHQGTVWAWLIGPYAEAVLRAGRFDKAAKEAARAAIAALLEDLRERGLGQLHEIYEGDAPHRPVGCVAQAWSVAEVLRVWRMAE